MNDNLQIIEYKELYKEILKRIDEQAKHRLIAPYKYIEQLGFKSKQYYTIRKYVRGEVLDNGMIYPLGETNLKNLCKEVNISFHTPMCMVEF